MLEGLHAAASGMIAQQQRMDALSSDIANVNTTGYKHLTTTFRDLAYSGVGMGGAQGIMAGAGAAADPAGRSFAQGALRITDQPLDIAIQGDGFLQVALPSGRTGLTRDGSLRVDTRGRLVTSTGALLQPPITLPRGVAPQDLAIAADGTLSAKGKPIGRLTLVTVEAPDKLRDAGNSTFETTPESGPPRAAGTDTTVVQGALEASNVDLGDAMVDLIGAQRAFQMASQAVRTQDQMLQIANQVKSQ